MSFFRHRLATGLLLLTLTGTAFAESSLQLSPLLSQPPSMAAPALAPSSAPVGVQHAPESFRLTPNPSQEVQDDSPTIPTIDLTTPPDDLWQRMRNGFAMTNLESPLVADRQAWYLNRPDLLRRVLDRSRRYLYHIVEELQKRGMPTELALLPIVESSYNPLAYSSARALGMWQFIPSTGKTYNLQQNWWLDQRRDIIASTSAALDYLQYIYEMHGDWHLALASYNWGEGAVGRAISKNQAKGLPTDYLSLNMPGETRYYVPKLQAIKNIIADPALFGIRIDPIPNRPYFGMVERSGDMDVALAARLAEIPVDEFIALNPAYSRPVMPDSASSPMVLPADKVQTFLSNLQRHEEQDKPLSSWLTHTLKKGETLDAIASRYGINGAKLRQLNGITKRTKVGPGLTLLVPSRSATQPEQLLAHLPQTPADPPKAAKGSTAAKAKPGKSTQGTRGTNGTPGAGSKTKPVRGKVATKAAKLPAKAAPKKKH
jgi:membrane-bound lytic murein transglycosylase D